METDHWAIRNFSFMDMATFGFGFSVFTSRMCCFLDFVSSTICDFLLFSLWLLVSILNVSWTFYKFFSSALKRKITKCDPRFEMDFVLNFAMCSAHFTGVNGSTVQIMFY